MDIVIAILTVACALVLAIASGGRWRWRSARSWIILLCTATVAGTGIYGGFQSGDDANRMLEAERQSHVRLDEQRQETAQISEDLKESLAKTIQLNTQLENATAKIMTTQAILASHMKTQIQLDGIHSQILAVNRGSESYFDRLIIQTDRLTRLPKSASQEELKQTVAVTIQNAKFLKESVTQFIKNIDSRSELSSDDMIPHRKRLGELLADLQQVIDEPLTVMARIDLLEKSLFDFRTCSGLFMDKVATISLDQRAKLAESMVEVMTSVATKKE
jgi:hypothetical protein